ncbi:nucleotide 5'-monophosphate nucleosidase PpnN [Pseudoteredinibacter isoporae]|uniref:nucleotide 5'-monophosphate nucleosidase PpnN n=1 Tax=Pseudoteredinibacter isoporae TaxID=570281 RepID=UPI0031043B0D
MSDKIKYASVRPTRSMNLLSHREMESLMDSHPEVHRLFRECALAILNAGSEDDDPELLLNSFKDFSIELSPQSRGVKLEVRNAPASAFVDGVMIRGIQDQLFDVLRDIVFTHNKLSEHGNFDLSNAEGISDAVFRILRNAGVVKPERIPNLVICWGGHSIDRLEYDYSKKVGYQMGLRGLDVGTGCGIGAMKGPMKGAAVGHAKQQIHNGRYVGITEPGIIASESPNPIVNELVILPDIEKRLEAFVRMAHCIIVFPGGAGTAEEVMYLLGILMHPDNRNIEVPLIFAAPEEKPEYFADLDRFIRFTLGDDAAQYYEIITGQPEQVARLAKQGVERVKRQRRRSHESYVYNWQLTIPESMQQPFIPDHENMAALALNKNVAAHELVANMRSAFSGIVAGNVKPYGIEQIREHGPYQLKGDADIMQAMDALLRDFVSAGRMKLKGEYTPCYELSH